jgi:glutamate synthase (NADPH/NADH) large chain
VILGGTGRNLGAGMSGGTAYIHDLKSERVNRQSLESGELRLEELGSADVEILTDLLQRHVVETESALATAMLANMEETIARFVKVVPRDYAAVLQARQTAIDEGLDPDGDVAWTRILEVTGG